MLRKLLFLTCVTGLFCLAGVWVPSAMAQQTGSIQGTVTDSLSGKTLAGTNIYIIDAKQGAATDANGQYKIENVSPGTYHIRATFIGYSTKIKTVNITNGETIVNFQLVSKSTNLDELVVVGFGTTTKKELISAVSTIQSKDLSTSTTQTLPQQLQGKVAGVQVSSTSGVLGAPISVRVRGTTSINASSQPLYVVDGVPLVRDQLGYNMGEPGSQAISPLVNLDPNTIESMSVLKGPAATAVYGARGANGVVIITTKKGHAGHAQVSIGVSGGFTQPTKKYDLMTASQWAKTMNYESQHYSILGLPKGIDVFGDLIDKTPDELTDANWADVVTRTGNIQNYTASVSGGNENTTYFFQGTYNNQHGYAEPNQLQKYNVLAKVNHQFNDHLHVGISINPTRSLNNRISTSNQVSAPYTLAALESPVVPRYYPNENVNDGAGLNGSTPLNTFAAFPGTPLSNKIGIFRDSYTTSIKADAHAAYDFIPQLTLKTQFSVQSLQVEEQIKRNKITTDGYPNGSAMAQNDQYLNYNWRTTLKYANNWNDHSLTVLAGMTFNRVAETGLNSVGNTFPTPSLKYLNSASDITGGGSFKSSYAFQNNILRLTYKFKNRYIVTLTGSYEGSSRFGSNNRYGFFPAVSAGWIISDENFAHTSWLSNLKLHAGYGAVGNASIGNYPSLALLGTGLNYNNEPGISLTQLASPNLTWEKTVQLDLGLDYGFINNRIRGTISYYIKNTHDLLLGVPVSATNGFTSITKNIGKIRNKGIEFGITADIVRNKTLTWSVFGNISTNDNKVISIPSPFNSGHHRVKEGHALGAFFLPEYAGVNPNNGDAMYYLNGEPTQDQLDNSTVIKLDKFGGKYVTHNPNIAERVFVGNPYSDFFGGFGTSLNIAGFDASVNFQYQSGNKTYWQNGEFAATNLASVFGQLKSQLDYWTANNTDASIPEPRGGGNGEQPSTRYLLNSSYLRLKTAVIGYTLPRSLINGYTFRIYVQGQNLLTFTPYRGLDPEVTGSSEANVTQGTTFFELPQARSVIFGIQLRF